MTTPKHDLEHEVYLDPKDGKEHINHGMLEYSKEDLEMYKLVDSPEEAMEYILSKLNTNAPNF